MKNKIVIVGGIPEPTGGVTNFVYRLVTNYGESIAAVIDMYDTHNKVDLGTYMGDYHTISKGFFRIFKLATLLRNYKDNTVFFNFSRSYAFILLMFLPKFNGCRWILMLHHGDLKTSNGFISLFLRLAILIARRKIDKVLALSEDQRIFYEGYSFKNILNTTSYVPCSLPVNTFGYIQHIAFNLRKRGKIIIIASGFPRRIYNHSWVVDFVKKNDAALLLFLYGDGECLQDLSDSCARVEDCYLFYGCTEPAFNFALSQADVYVRPNDVDSFGIACADAITLGIQVLASDVCERYAGCETYRHNRGSKEFANRLNELIIKLNTIKSHIGNNRSHFNISSLLR